MQTYPSGDQNPGPLPVDDIGNNPLRETEKANDSQADNIRHVQFMLFELGYLLGQRSKMLDGVDGIFGPDTDTAVRQFQREHKDWEGKNLAVDGIVGHKTSDALNREMVGVLFGSYFSVDKDGNNVPADSPLLTVDFDADAIPAFTGSHTIAIHGFPSIAPAGPDRCCNLFPNDPEAVSDAPMKEVYLLHLRPSLGESIPTWKLADDKTASGTAVGPSPVNFPPPGRFDPGETDASSPPGLAFQRCQVHVTLARVVRMWRMNGLRFGSWSIGSVLPVILQHDALLPRLNGMFTGSDLELGFHDVAKIWTAETADLVSHELGHAVFRATAPSSITGSGKKEVRAFNEAFADITAILTTLTDPDVRRALIDGTGGDLAQSSFVSKLTEQVGIAGSTRTDTREELRIICPPGNTIDLGVVNYPFTDTDCVRNAFNDFKYSDPATLPCNFGSGENFHNTVIWPTVDGGGDKPHGFSRIFSGAFYDSIANAFDRLKSSASSDDEALRQAAGGMAKILAKALTRSGPPAERFYNQLSKKMFEVDRINFGKDFRADMIGLGDANGFVGREILAEDEVDAVSPA